MTPACIASLTEEQRSAVAYLAQREAAALIRRAVEGASDRIERAVKAGVVELPIFHLDELARVERSWSSGNADDVSAPVRA